MPNKLIDHMKDMDLRVLKCSEEADLKLLKMIIKNQIINYLLFGLGFILIAYLIFKGK